MKSGRRSFFKLSEFACGCGCGFDSPSMELVDRLEHARELYGQPIRVNSGCRCRAHNKAVGGVSGSAHLSGQAGDLSCISSTNRFKLINSLYGAGFRRIKVYKRWIHVDVDKTKPQDVLIVE